MLARRDVDVHLVVLLIDLDNFKAINDEHGHPAGDRALVEVSQVLRFVLDNQTVATRSGGEEFLLAGVSAMCNAESLATQMCRDIAALPAGVTASIGTACARLDDTTPREHQPLLEALIATADAAMYRAKRLGGNQCHHHNLC